MLKRKLGNTGIEVAAIGLGGMPMSISGRPDEAQSIATIHAALELGIDFVDTANVYCIDDNDIGHNERLIAKALKTYSGKKDNIIVATKGGLTRPQGRWELNNSPEFLRSSCEMSLQSLGLGSIVLYQLHAPGQKDQFLNAVEEMVKLQKEGKIQHIGLSNVDTDEIKAAMKIATITSVQNRCNLFEHGDMDDGLVGFCRANNITYIPYSPVGGFRTHTFAMKSAKLSEFAAKKGVSPYQVAIAWLLAKSDNILPIPGASKPSSIIDSFSAIHLTLTPDEVALFD